MKKRMTKAQREAAEKAALLQRVRDVLIGANEWTGEHEPLFAAGAGAMSDKVDLAEIEHLGRLLFVDSGDLYDGTNELLALVRVARAAMVYFNHLENEGFCDQTITQPEGQEVCAIVEGMRSALAAFTDSRSELADSAKENSDD